jgi:hypothetical protein
MACMFLELLQFQLAPHTDVLLGKQYPKVLLTPPNLNLGLAPQ